MWNYYRDWLIKNLKNIQSSPKCDSFERSLKIDYTGVNYERELYATTEIDKCLKLLKEIKINTNNLQKYVPLDNVKYIYVVLENKKMSIKVYFQVKNLKFEENKIAENQLSIVCGQWFWNLNKFAEEDSLKLYRIVHINSFDVIKKWLEEFVVCPKLLESLCNIFTQNTHKYALSTYKTSSKNEEETLYGFHVKLFGNMKLKDISKELSSVIYLITQSKNEYYKIEKLFKFPFFSDSYVTWISVGKNNTNRLNVNVYYKNLCDECDKIV